MRRKFCLAPNSPFTGILHERGIVISMDGRGRAFDNIFIERLWRTVKQEEVYLKDYQCVAEAEEQLRQYFKFYIQRGSISHWGIETLGQSIFRRRKNEVESGSWDCGNLPVICHTIPTGFLQIFHRRNRAKKGN